MRIAPMIVWASALEETEFHKAIIADVELTHPNRLVHEAIMVYGTCIRELLNNPKDKNKAIKAFSKSLNLAMESCDYECPKCE
jgi:ADP-ribosylglycohydrolase